VRPGAGAAAVAIALAAAACAVDAPRFVDGDAGTDAAAPAGPHVEVNPATLEVGEGGQVVVRVRLSERPRAPVIVTVRASDPQRLEVAPVSLELSPASWNVERVVTVRAIGDDDADDDQVAVVFAGGGVVADGSALVAITDDDELRLVVTPAATLQVGEGGSAPVQVRLSARPRVPVTVAVSADPSGVVALAPARLTFAPTTWSVEQTVTVTGAVDLDVVDDRVKVTLAPDLDGVDRHALDVTVIDEDVLNILATPANLGTLVEGGSGRTLQVRLTQQPSGALTIALAAAPGDAVTLTPPTLDFDPATWSMPRTVTVAAPDDADVNDEQVTITLSAAGLASRTVTATVADDDVQAPVVAPTAVTLAEGQHATVGVRLAHDPGGPVQVTAAIVGADLVAVSPAQLVFTSATWAQPQAVTVTARDDEDDAGGQHHRPLRRGRRRQRRSDRHGQRSDGDRRVPATARRRPGRAGRLAARGRGGRAARRAGVPAPRQDRRRGRGRTGARTGPGPGRAVPAQRQLAATPAVRRRAANRDHRHQPVLDQRRRRDRLADVDRHRGHRRRGAGRRRRRRAPLRAVPLVRTAAAGALRRRRADEL